MINYKEFIKDVRDFPKPGILFRDVSPLLKNAEALTSLCNDFAKLIDLKTVDYFVGIESRGFIFASMMAARFNKGFVPLRKAGKLPPPLIAESYDLEYGTATLEINSTLEKRNVVICDDVLATGGTLKAAINLCTKAGYQIQDVLVLIDLTFLNQMQFNGKKINSLIQY
jgi:adenine phosphoribosyltransferase